MDTTWFRVRWERGAKGPRNFLPSISSRNLFQVNENPFPLTNIQS